MFKANYWEEVIERLDEEDAKDVVQINMQADGKAPAKPKVKEVKNVPLPEIPPDGFPSPPLGSPYCQHKGVNAWNLVITFDVCVRLDLSQVVQHTHGKLTERFPGVIFHTRTPSATVIAFVSGKHLLLGTRSLSDALVVSQYVMRLYVSRINAQARLCSLFARNVVCHTQVGPLDIEAFAQDFVSRVIYNPEVFNGAQWLLRKNPDNMRDRKTVNVAFATGKNVATGARSTVEHKEMFAKTCEIIQAYRADTPDCKRRWRELDAAEFALWRDRVTTERERRAKAFASMQKLGPTFVAKLLAGRTEQEFLSAIDMGLAPPETHAQRFWKSFLTMHGAKARAAIDRHRLWKNNLPLPVDENPRNRKRFKVPPAKFRKGKSPPEQCQRMKNVLPEDLQALVPEGGYCGWLAEPCPRMDATPEVSNDKNWDKPKKPVRKPHPTAPKPVPRHMPPKRKREPGPLWSPLDLL